METIFVFFRGSNRVCFLDLCVSDISHTMQHWHIYIKWNERFFHEMYLAYKQGRIDKDPSESWYAGEIGFFDFYSEYIYQAMSMDPSWCSVLCNTAISSLLFCCAHLD